MGKRMCLMAWLLWAFTAQADDQPFGSVYKMPVWVDNVTHVCPWKSRVAEGYIRVVMTDVDGRNSLFLQWIRKGLSGTPAQIVSTMQVLELDKYRVRLQMPQASLAADACHLITMGDAVGNERRYQFDVVLKGPGQYRVDVTQFLPGGM